MPPSKLVNPKPAFAIYRRSALAANSMAVKGIEAYKRLTTGGAVPDTI